MTYVEVMHDAMRGKRERMSHIKKVPYPENRVVATLDADALDASLTALSSTGIARDSILVITPDDIGNVESPLTETGVSGFVHRLLLSFGVDLALLEQLRDDVVERGRVIVMVPVEEGDQKDQVVETLRNQRAHAIRYAGRWTIEVL